EEEQLKKAEPENVEDFGVELPQVAPGRTRDQPVEAVLPALRAGDDGHHERAIALVSERVAADDDGVREIAVTSRDASQRLVRRAPGPCDHSMRAPTARRCPARKSRAAMVRRPSGRSSRI